MPLPRQPGARPVSARPRLVLIDVSQLPADKPTLPSLEEFAESRGLEEFSQAEQIEAYVAEFGRASRRQSRRGRLVERQLEALRWLEGVVSQPPGPGDSVCAWLNPTIALRLERAKIFTLAQLIERVNGLGQGWAVSIAGIGKAKGEQVLAWLRSNEEAIGMSVGRHVQQRRTELSRHELARVVAPATDIRPLEKLVVPVDLDGTRGAFRRP